MKLSKNKLLFLILLVFVVYFGLFWLKNTSSKKIVDSEQTRAVIFPHHDLLQHKFDEFYSSFSAQRKNVTHRVLILSPNHFQPDINFIQKDKVITDQDHGVAIHLPFIQKYFADSEIIPMLYTRNIPKDVLDDNILELKNLYQDEDTILIVSIDFSHYLSAEDAINNDEVTKRMICEKNQNELLKLSDDYLDCPACVYVLLNLLNQEDKCPSVQFHGNSSDFLDDEKITTSYFVMWF